MTSEQPNVSPTGRYTITQAASILGVHRNTIHNWIGSGVFKPSEYNMRKATKKVFITGIGIRRVWSATMY